jgi:outer membrane protein TolC
LHDAETAAARAHTSAAVQLVALYKALGGGWDAPAMTSQTTNPALKPIATVLAAPSVP